MKRITGVMNVNTEWNPNEFGGVLHHARTAAYKKAALMGKKIQGGG